MLKAYIVNFNCSQCARQKVLDLLDTLPAIKNWYAFLPSAIFVVSDQTAHALAQLLLAKVDGSYYFISEITSGTANGWLPQAAWDFVNNPKSSGRWP
jgi:hypothetical protein